MGFIKRKPRETSPVMLVSYFIDLRILLPVFSHLSPSTSLGLWEARQILPPFYKGGSWSQEKWCDSSTPCHGPRSSKQQLSDLSDPKSCAFLLFLGSKCNFLCIEASTLLSIPSLPYCLHLCLNFCFLLASMLKEFSGLPSSTAKGREEWELLPCHCLFEKSSLPLFPKSFWGIRKTEMWNRKSLLFVLVFDNVCNLSGWFKRFRYFL